MIKTLPSTKDLFEAGVHYGHPANKWHPKMGQYIYKQMLGVHIIDLTQTEELLKKAANFLKEESSKGAQVVFVGTKRQASEIVKIEAERAKAFYVCNRWIGGMLTNVATIRANLKKLSGLRNRLNSGDFDSYTKKEKNSIKKQISKLESIYGGIEGMTHPSILVVVDPKKEMTAVKEAKKLGMRVVALTDTNANPELVDYVIPANTGSIRSIDVVISVLSDAVMSGVNTYLEKKAEAKVTSKEDVKISEDSKINESSDSKSDSKKLKSETQKN
jgi:small subunit ribosomal protein S2